MIWGSLDELVHGGILDAEDERGGQRYRLRSKLLAGIYSQSFDQSRAGKWGGSTFLRSGTAYLPR